MNTNRRSFLKQSLFLGAGWAMGSKLVSPLVFRPLTEDDFGDKGFAAPLLHSLQHHDRIAILGVDFSGAHTAAHMINDYLFINGTDSRLFSNLQPQTRYHNAVFIKKFAPSLEKQKPGEKFIVSIRMRRRGFNEVLDLLKMNQFKIFIFETPSRSHAAMNSLIFKKLRVGSLVFHDFKPEAIPTVKATLEDLRYFEIELKLLQTAKSVFPDSTLLEFNEAAYQRFVKTYLKSFPTWREPYLLNPETKLLNPEIVTSLQLLRA